LATSTSKKVLIQRFDREPLTGFVNIATYIGTEGIELLSQSGVVSVVSWPDAKSVFFVRDFRDEDAGETRRAFLSRPKLDGLWLRLSFRDGDTLEGVMPNNLLQVEATGLSIIPPAGAQRVFVPRMALNTIQVLGVVGSPLRSGTGRKRGDRRDQIGLFAEGEPRP